MKTSKPFSTISYNSTEFLQVKLDDLVKRNIITFWAFIQHYPENDETKAHKHVYMVPNGLYNTDGLHNYLKEFVSGFEFPLGIMPITSSKFADWFLYALHDKLYLASKGQSREMHYSIDDIITSDRDYLIELSHMIDYSKYQRLNEFIARVEQGQPLASIIKSGLIPPAQILQYTKVFDIVVGKFNTYKDTKI